LSDGLLRIRRNYLIGGGIVVSVILTISYLTKTFSPSVQNVVFHDYIYRGFRAMIVLLFIISLNILFRNLHFDPNPKNYLKVYWLIWGIIFGSAPFLLFWNIPQLFGYQPLVPEWLVTLWLIIIPVSIAISIIKYRLFDIEIILSRSIVYFAVIAILLVFYIVLVGGLSLVVNQQFSLQSPVFSLFTAVGIGLVFNPLKERVTHVIDRKFFRIRYDRFLALKRFLNTSEKCYTQKMVLLVLREQYHSVVPLRHSFFAMLETNKWRFLPKMAEDCEKWYNVLNDALFFNKKEIVINESHQSLVEDLEGKIIHLLPDKGVVLVPVGSAVFWCLGKKLSGARFWKEDMELAEQMAQAAAIQLEKVHYFQRSVEEAMEKERAQQLSRWKTLLVAEVAHDLRSPLNTILWKLRNLQQTLQEQEESRLQPMVDIRGQIEHLQALIQTLLILPRVEEGKYRVQWQMLPLKCVVAEVLSHLEGIISGKGLQVTVDCPADLTLRADLTLLKEILLNLLDNAAKFSPPGKNIIVRAFPETSGKKERVRIIISDEAGGIPPGQQRLIFEPFHEGEKEGGRIHLGLYIAREFTRLMGGELQLRSEYGKGTEVELCFEK
jgi:signal transduction histidine kinase